MAVDVLILLFPLVLAIHNFDEFRRYEDFISAYHLRLPSQLTARPVAFWAAIALTGFAAAICLGAFSSKNPTLMLVAKISICALMLNAVTHCALSFKRRSLLPGTLSACILVLPYSLMALIVMRIHGGDSPADLALYVVLGAVTIPISVTLSLIVGYGIAAALAPTNSR